MTTATIKSKFRTLKIGINLLLLAILSIIIAQNSQTIDIKVLIWEAHFPLVFLLLGTAVLSALVVFLFMLIKR